MFYFAALCSLLLWPALLLLCCSALRSVLCFDSAVLPCVAKVLTGHAQVARVNGEPARDYRMRLQRVLDGVEGLEAVLAEEVEASRER